MPTLTWLTRKTDLKLSQGAPYRLLGTIPELSYGDPESGNMLIQGDNLDGLKALLPYYAGQVKCIYIDPPYNTKSAFEHYDDNLEHTKWLSTIYPRLELLRELLSEEGSIWVSIDDNEGHYLKVIMDEVFGRKNFIANVIWQKRTSRENRAAIGTSHDHILLYGRNDSVQWKEHRNLLPGNEAGYANPDNDQRGVWRSIPFSAQGYRKNQMYDIVTPTGKTLSPPKGRCWGATEPEYLNLLTDNKIYFPKNGDGRPRIKQFPENQKGLVPMTLWAASEVGDTEDSKKEILELFKEHDPFGTPKPESLIQRIIHIATNPGDLVLDSFLGSGTTCAVAHKMGRRYIGIEMGEHAVTHCAPRLRQVIDAEQGGISKSVDWQGGGGFRFYRLGDAVFDDAGKINSNIRFATLAAHIWFCETGTPLTGEANSPFLGIYKDIAYYLLFNGILGDKRPAGGNVLTSGVLRDLHSYAGEKVIYGETSRLTTERMRLEQITFKQIPYDIKAR
ncbi:MAG: site-specific DNA-methyltransferase [Syntrophus sp. (in: bacteria)]|nr:site-specific DNA-methyltransferase [Syntrophus sp. (in: bacteria)]